MVVLLWLIVLGSIIAQFHFDQLKRNAEGIKTTYDVVSSIPRTVLMPLPESGFDPTEAAVSWKVLKKLGHEVVFATPTGKKSDGCDPVVLDGILGGLVMKVHPQPLAYYEEMVHSPEYGNPISYQNIELAKYDGLLLPGGRSNPFPVV
jgi:hypothetical protein